MHNHHRYRYDYDHHDHHYLCTVVVFSKGTDNNFKNKNNVDQNAVYRYYEAGVPSGVPGIAIKTGMSINSRTTAEGYTDGKFQT